MIVHTFNFPKCRPEEVTNIKCLTNRESFPAISVNVTPNSYKSDFIQVASPSGNSDEEKITFRSRNNFIIARSTLANLVQEKQSNFEKVSKLVSIVLNVSFKLYFEYLAILESYWYEKKSSTLHSPKKAKNIVGIKYSEIFTSLYPESSVETKMKPQKHRFRLTNAPVRTRKRLVKKKESVKGFKIGKTSYSCNYGILTQDIFKEELAKGESLLNDINELKQLTSLIREFGEQENQSTQIGNDLNEKYFDPRLDWALSQLQSTLETIRNFEGESSLLVSSESAQEFELNQISITVSGTDKLMETVNNSADRKVTTELGKPRKRLASSAKNLLEQIFLVQQTPNRRERELIARKCGVTPLQIRVWVCIYDQNFYKV
ncbi:uncharacterized protein KGF55_002112 [Candida pseudojiufengensis]|uniref:uncharacterized protein n=1 Tax=Candida pseudojiufengensis TaxID=497109 RepID=UPI002224EF47|nr:uncharacterized protein KGF55_002112 [Candida pseudojiufengensis]KAI5964170.1 hypothetical protein KGF55_002112 [Candida pseudojiufengensis]